MSADRVGAEPLSLIGHRMASLDRLTLNLGVRFIGGTKHEGRRDQK